MDKTKKADNKTKYRIRQISIIILAVCAIGFAFLAWTGARIQNAVDAAVQSRTKAKALEFRDELRKDLAVLDTANELWGAALNEGRDMRYFLDTVLEKYQISGIGYVTEELTFFDYRGDEYPYDASKEETLWGITKEHFDTVMERGPMVFRPKTGFSGDGLVFAMPFHQYTKQKAILCYKIPVNVLQTRLLSDSDGVYWFLTDEKENVLLTDGNITKLLGDGGWDSFVENGRLWKNKSDFEHQMEEEQCGVWEIKRKNGAEFYLSATSIYGFENLFLVRISDISVAKKEIASSMLLTTAVLMLIVIFLFIVAVYSAVTSIRNRRELYKAAFVDQLTGLPSKTKHKLDAQELINRQDKKYAYIAFDVENFKYINELFGYEIGNRLLIHLSEILQRFTQKGELCSRVSGDNFAMLVEFIDRDTIKERMKKIFHAMSEYTEDETDLMLCAVRFACGVYVIEGAENINKIRANANLARIESKKQIFDKIIFYDEVLKTRHVEEHELEYDSREALEKGDFVVFYQPKYNSVSEKIIGAEALIRWNHPRKGMISPAQFIPVFEANGFIIEIDLFVLRKTCEMIADWLKRGIQPICISVNLSRTHLYEQNLADQLEKVVQSYHIPPEYIEFELTESAMYEDMEILMGVMEELRKKGFRLSMDDFGSGYSSLNLLKRMPVDVLKLDKEFLDEGDENPKSRDKRIIWHVIAMAKDLEMAVLAEGVETKEQKMFLQAAHCDIIQGYYFAKPMPKENFEAEYIKQLSAEGE